MAAKRKDQKGHVLRDGESQRKNLTYQYRFADTNGKRHCIYAPTLDELRKKEGEINKIKAQGCTYDGGDATVLSLVDLYIERRKPFLRPNTISSYMNSRAIIQSSSISSMTIRSIKVSDAKAWLNTLALSNNYHRGSVDRVRSLLKLAFEIAVEDDVLVKNPFQFRLSLQSCAKEEPAPSFSHDEQNRFLAFLKETPDLAQYYDQFYILLHTGLRASEFAGLTKRDIDFKHQRICVAYQLQRDRNGGYIVLPPKTASGTRYIPMIGEVSNCLRNVLANRECVNELMIDGRAGFLFLSCRGMPKVQNILAYELQKCIKRYNETHSDQLPPVSPHGLRHTFCTNMAEAGLDPKHLQYIMGHSNVDITLNVYRHVSYDDAEAGVIKLGLATSSRA